MDRRHPLEWVPPLLVGGSAAVASEVAVGLLLYAGPGFVRSLTIILAVEGLALSAGLWNAPPPGEGLVDAVRRRWLLCLFAFLVAASFGVVWTVMGTLGETPWSQGLGLALLAGLPLYATGTVLAGIVRVSRAGDATATTIAAPAALGAALGFLLTGFLLPRAPVPGSLLLICLVLLSLAGMVFGVVVGRDVRRETVGRTVTGDVEVRVEDRHHEAHDTVDRVLLENDHERSRKRSGSKPAASWDVALMRALSAPVERPWRVLSFGGGASALAREVVVGHPDSTVRVLERTGAVVEAARSHMATGADASDTGRVVVTVGNLEDLIKAVRERYDLVVVDTGALEPIGGAESLSREARARLVTAVAEDGLMAWGPRHPGASIPELAAEWPVVEFSRSLADAGDETVLVFTRPTAPRVAVEPAGFQLQNGTSAAP